MNLSQKKYTTFLPLFESASRVTFNEDASKACEEIVKDVVKFERVKSGSFPPLNQCWIELTESEKGWTIGLLWDGQGDYEDRGTLRIYRKRCPAALVEHFG